MSVKVAINGFGRIGRLAFRKMFGDPEFEIAAINDLTKAEMLCYLLKYDSVQGAYRDHRIECGEAFLSVDGKEIPVFAEPDPGKLPWKELGIDVVLECTGFFASKEKASSHLKAGAGKVLPETICRPSSTASTINL